MEGNFNKKIAGLSSKIKAFNKPLKDIITMASIVEKEANTMEDRKMISGVLWKRIEEGMLLQVDPPFYYILNKTGGITFDDLKIKSPYNTYINNYIKEIGSKNLNTFFYLLNYLNSNSN